MERHVVFKTAAICPHPGRAGEKYNAHKHIYGLSPPSSTAKADDNNKDSKDYGLKSTREPSLGSPSVANCLAAACEFHQSGPLELKATDGPIIKIAGNCAISIGFKRKTLTSWDLLKAVIYSLLEQCLDNLYNPYSARCIQWGKTQKAV